MGKLCSCCLLSLHCKYCNFGDCKGLCNKDPCVTNTKPYIPPTRKLNSPMRRHFFSQAKYVELSIGKFSPPKFELWNMDDMKECTIFENGSTLFFSKLKMGQLVFQGKAAFIFEFISKVQLIEKASFPYYLTHTSVQYFLLNTSKKCSWLAQPQEPVRIRRICKKIYKLFNI